MPRIGCMPIEVCFFCNACGFVAGHKVRKLRKPCGEDLPQIPTSQGADNLDRLWHGLLPRSTPAWPADASLAASSSIHLGSIPPDDAGHS